MNTISTGRCLCRASDVEEDRYQLCSSQADRVVEGARPVAPNSMAIASPRLGTQPSGHKGQTCPSVSKGPEKLCEAAIAS